MPFNQPSTYEEPAGTVTPSGTGTQDDPYNVAAAIKKCKELGTTLSEDKYYVKGYVTQATKADATYGNATFTIADAVDGSDLFTCYQIAGENGQKLTAGYEFNVGDVVTVYGKIYNYSNKTPETEGKGAAWLVAHEKNGEGGGETTDAKKVTIAEFNAAEVDNDTWYELTGTVKNLKDGDLYGNFDLEDATGSVYVYGLLSEKGGAKKLFQELVTKYGIANGSTITIHANRGEYNGKIEAVNAYYVPEGEGGEAGGDQATTVANFLAAEVSTDVWYKLTGTVKNLKDGDQYGNFDLEDATGSVYVYGLLSEKGGAKKLFQDLVKAQGIANGSKITIMGNRGEYNGKAQVTNAYFVSVEGGSGGDTPSGSGDGTKNSPYSVSAAQAAGDKTGAYMKGYIVGFVSGQVYADGATFSADGAVASNVLLADSPNETDASKCMPIQLPSGAVRTALNLQNNASNLKKEVTLYGDLTKYFGQAGLKNVTYAILDGTEIGTNPDGGSGGGDTGTTYTLATTFSAGTYVIAANNSGTYEVATPLTGNYGYLQKADVTPSNNKITTDATNEFTFTAVNGGYTIKAGGKYYYMNGTYNSFNVSEDLPTSGHIWTVTMNNDNTVTITNVEKNKTIQYDTQYNSYGAYDTTKGIFPALFKK